jgi:xylan 1,4-beta-xylosidase
MKSETSKFGVAALLICCCVCAMASGQTQDVRVVFSEPLGAIEMEKMALGQGGLSVEPMWENRAAEVSALQPAIIRLFVQEYFDLVPEPGKYHFTDLDRSVDLIRRTDATPLMSLCFKPRLLFPQIDQDVVEPNDYAQWQELIFELVKHYQENGKAIRYWEIANEPDIGEDGGCPYRFKPESYLRYYTKTAAAIRRADPTARVGGPALAYWRSPILPALLQFCSTNGAPLDFVSWHIYSSDPKAVRATITGVKELLKSYPDLKVETFLDEWNMDLTNPPLDPRFQPCYVAEVIWNMKEAGLDYSCYYHIRDYYVDYARFSRFMSPQGTAFMARWWNRMPQFDGLFDYQNTVRPAYFTFKLLSRLRGERLRVQSAHSAIHGFASHDEKMRMFNLLLWNFSAEEIPAELVLESLPREMRSRHMVVDARTSATDENARLRPEPFKQVQPGERLRISFEPYAIHYWSLE